MFGVSLVLFISPLKVWAVKQAKRNFQLW